MASQQVSKFRVTKSRDKKRAKLSRAQRYSVTANRELKRQELPA